MTLTGVLVGAILGIVVGSAIDLTAFSRRASSRVTRTEDSDTTRKLPSAGGAKLDDAADAAAVTKALKAAEAARASEASAYLATKAIDESQRKQNRLAS